MSKIDERTKKKAVAEYHRLGNASAIARKYGVARSTFLAWLPAITNTIETDTPEATEAVVAAIQSTADAAIRSMELSAATRQEFLQRHYDGVSNLFATLVDKMTKELNDETKHPSLRDQAAALTALTNFVKEFTPHDDEQGKVQINLLQQTLNR